MPGPTDPTREDDQDLDDAVLALAETEEVPEVPLEESNADLPTRRPRRPAYPFDSLGRYVP